MIPNADYSMLYQNLFRRLGENNLTLKVNAYPFVYARPNDREES